MPFDIDPVGCPDEQAHRPAAPAWITNVPAHCTSSWKERVRVVQDAENPLLEAAQPLLRALADVPADLGGVDVGEVHRLLGREVGAFQALCHEARIRSEHAVAASYALCTALDEAAASTAWGGGRGAETGVWATQHLAARFHGDVKGGDKVFLLVGRLAAAPHDHTDLLEVLYLVLGLGFEGRFGGGPEGPGQLQAIRGRLLLLLEAARGEAPVALSTQAANVGAIGRPRRWSIPVGLTATACALVVAALYAGYRYRLGWATDETVRRIASIAQVQPPAPAVLPPAHAPIAAPLRLKALLAQEIARGTVSVDEDAVRSVVNFRGDDMFEAGRASLSPRIVPILDKVAREIDRVPGPVRITGHSDNQPIASASFPNNQVLSERRAQAVATRLEAQGVVRTRLQIVGRGANEPVASNTGAADRARNRRVELVVSQPMDAADR